MSELEVRIGKLSGNEYTVLAKHVDENGLEYLWVGERGNIPFNASRKWLNEKTDPKPDFFEEGKDYKLYGTTYTIWHVHEMAYGKVAVAQDTDGLPMLLSKDDWETFKRRNGLK